MTEKRFKTRYLLPLEMCVGLHLFCMGVAGSWNGGAVREAVEASGSPAVWTAVMVALGLAALLVAMLEWFGGALWENGTLRRVLNARKWLSLLAAIAWSFAVYTMLRPETDGLIYVILASVPMSGFALWSWWVNYRTECVLDPSLKTSQLERELEAKRAHW